MPPIQPSSKTRIIVKGNGRSEKYLKSYNLESRKVSWTPVREDATELGPMGIFEAQGMLKAQKVDVRIVKKTHLERKKA
jgi:hypothetical protein